MLLLSYASYAIFSANQKFAFYAKIHCAKSFGIRTMILYAKIFLLFWNVIFISNANVTFLMAWKIYTFGIKK